MTLRRIIEHSVKRTVEIGAVALWYQFVQLILQKHYFHLILLKASTFYFALSLFDDITSLK